MDFFSTFTNIIDGKPSPTRATRHGINPANKQPLWDSPLSTQEDVNYAVDAARRAAPGWAATPWPERQKRLVNLADAVTAHRKDLAKLLTMEQGKAGPLADREIVDSVRMLKGAAELTLPDIVVERGHGLQTITRYDPVGVCVTILPWNFPLVLATLSLGYALAAGNPVILKPSPFTPYTDLKFVELAQQFFPPGVVQALSGDEQLGPWLTEHPLVDKISFTGSTATGIKVMQSCSATLKRVTLELGGNDPAIICPSVDIGATAAKIAMIALYNSGQMCIAIKRIYVHASIYEPFMVELSKAVDAMVVGDGLDEGTFIGPVQNDMQYRKLQALAASIEKAGLKTTSGSPASAFSNTNGYFVNPILVDNPPDDSEVVTEEAFGNNIRERVGPIVPVLKWNDEEEVLRRANVNNGLGSSVWSQDPAQSSRLARQLKAGIVWINQHMELRPDAAFGGFGQSGVGCSLGVDGLKSFCNTQTICCEPVADL